MDKDYNIGLSSILLLVLIAMSSSLLFAKGHVKVSMLDIDILSNVISTF